MDHEERREVDHEEHQEVDPPGKRGEADKKAGARLQLISPSSKKPGTQMTTEHLGEENDLRLLSQ